MATAKDAEDGPNCCKLTRSSDKYSVLGYGKTRNYFFGRLGSHTITARTTDSKYHTAQATISMTFMNEPPIAQIINPAMNNQSFYKGIPYLLAGDGTDPDGTNTTCVNVYIMYPTC